MGSEMVALDRALLSSCGLSVATVTLSVMDWPQFAIQIFTGGSNPQISPSHGELGPLTKAAFTLTGVQV